MLERLFSSRVRVQLLTLLLLNPGRSFHIRELARRLGASYSNVHRELRNLTELGLLERTTAANALRFSANESHFLYRDLRAILLKTSGVGDALRQELTCLGDVELAAIYGSTAKAEERAHSDIDLLLVGDLNVTQLEQVLNSIEDRIGRPVNYTLYTPNEWETKLAERDPFVMRVMAGDKVMLLGEKNEPAGA